MPVFDDNRPLLDGFRAGHPDALAAVYRHYVKQVSLLVRLGFVIDGRARVKGAGDPDSERDLIQEVFVRAFNEPARLAFDGLRPYRPYLLRIAKNILIDRARKSGREVPFSLGRDDPGVGDIDPIIEADAALSRGDDRSLEENTDWRRRRQATRAYLETVEEELATFIELRFVDESSQQEIAERLGVTRRRVRTLENRALRGLQQFLERRGLSRD